MRFKEYNQEQLWLIPPDIEDEIPRNDLCRVINDIIDDLDISVFENKYKEEGNPAYHPRMMLKVLLYSYSNRIFSSRRIAQELERNIFYWYLSGKQRPDFRTLALFRRKHSAEMKEIFVQIVKLCIGLGLVDFTNMSIDGTKIKANARKDRFFDNNKIDKKITGEEKRIEELLQAAEEIDREEDEHFGSNSRGDEIPEEIADRRKRIEKLKKLRQEMDEKGIKRINETDGECKLMKSQGKYLPAYNGQAIVDGKTQIILVADLVDCENDWGQVKPNIEIMKQEYNRKPDVILADTGYCDGPTLQYLEQEGIHGIIPDKPMSEIKKELQGKTPLDKLFKKDQFTYDPECDIYICPKGKELKRSTKTTIKYARKSGGNVEAHVYHGAECRGCISLDNCCRGKKKFRRIIRYKDEKLREEMAARIRSKSGYELYKQRMSMIEPVFGNIKQNLGFTVFSMRGLIKAQGEFLMIAIVHNIKKMARFSENPV